ncbi:MAG TPA: sn-glycerol-3-phosphate ABC transporter ATP-binding protein UgpC [Beijerinckiaceae bacterium]|jgi:sn-glycerol 3-phosphate transport system ATP-binding protein|nr:sn-glycerol-3-phosphate ABC transporter ATP-binding protein UgpC [Beijerinckiaceae bacterium]
MAAVVLSEVRKIYAGGFEAVKGVSFTVPDGGLCVLVGPSGCGKSTLLRMVAGLETVSSGDIRIGERRVNDLEPMARDIAMVFQNYALYPHMSVFDNMAYGLRNRGTPKPEIEARVKEAARILELEPLLARKPRQLSGGQRQRVAMGRAIVRKPAAFLFDEPLSNLDAKLRVQMRIEIRKLQRELETTSIYVTHDQLEAMTLADRLVVMNAGHMEQVGTALEVFQQPASVFVAGFIGSPPMNFLPAEVEAPGRLRLHGGAALAYDPARIAAQAGRRVLAGLRPETVALRRAGNDGSAPRFKLELIEELGMGRLVHGKVGERAFTVAQGASDPPPQGEAFIIEVAPSKVHLFDETTGARLSSASGNG